MSDRYHPRASLRQNAPGYALTLSTQAAQLQNRVAAQARGGLWEVVGAIIPAPVLIAAVVVFGGFEAFKYWQNGQQLTAQATIKEAEAGIAKIRAMALNTKDGEGAPLSLVAAEAELEKARAEAANAKIDADAMNAKIGDTTARLAQLQAELAAKEAQAAKKGLEAKAALDRMGVLTLEQRAARAKLMITELKAAKDRNAAYNARFFAAHNNDYTMATFWAAALRGECIDNSFAREAGCPEGLITRQPPKIQTPLEATLERLQGAQRLPQRAEATPVAFKASDAFATVNTLNLSLRPCPKPTNECPAYVPPLPQGTRVRLLGDADQNGWVSVEVGLQGGATQKGFVNGKYLAREKASD